MKALVRWLARVSRAGSGRSVAAVWLFLFGMHVMVGGLTVRWVVGSALVFLAAGLVKFGAK